jgi:hypothetical protein
MHFCAGLVRSDSAERVSSHPHLKSDKISRLSTCHRGPPRRSSSPDSSQSRPCPRRRQPVCFCPGSDDCTPPTTPASSATIPASRRHSLAAQMVPPDIPQPPSTTLWATGVGLSPAHRSSLTTFQLPRNGSSQKSQSQAANQRKIPLPNLTMNQTRRIPKAGECRIGLLLIVGSRKLDSSQTVEQRSGRFVSANNLNWPISRLGSSSTNKEISRGTSPCKM